MPKLDTLYPKFLGLRLDDRSFVLLKRAARARGVSQSDLVRSLVQKEIESHGPALLETRGEPRARGRARAWGRNRTAVAVVEQA